MGTSVLGFVGLKLWFVFCLKEQTHSHKEATAKVAGLINLENWSGHKGLRLQSPPSHFDLPLPWEGFADIEVVALCPGDLL